jgi:hypothetical protein
MIEGIMNPDIDEDFWSPMATTLTELAAEE